VPSSGSIPELPHVEKVQVLTRPNFFSAVGAVFSFGRGGASSSTSDSTERVLNRSAAVINVNRRCRWYFSRFATTIDLRLFQQNRPIGDFAYVLAVRQLSAQVGRSAEVTALSKADVNSDDVPSVVMGADVKG
jgi:hypothetical protein